MTMTLINHENYDRLDQVITFFLKRFPTDKLPVQINPVLRTLKKVCILIPITSMPLITTFHYAWFPIILVRPMVVCNMIKRQESLIFITTKIYQKIANVGISFMK
ncbi:hypothetical protein AB840_04805 [Megasphaera cerevisiae DSM 20462]|uniref:Uncharacterized protein n=1 Tax=Megasphaera cerevisiae DSM 20462 TaxID=1122219 RepID=A0A0J6WU84_9FIRM|nr:hypothetical protein AB840_04805 [Megasphaera cerevisiae DSM 20462]SJZ78332.1 hypothetical protein SAMN05660900_01445 [Megasphaera cerevisiae DSM 20462]